MGSLFIPIFRKTEGVVFRTPFSFGNGFTPTDIPQAEADALIALYDATGGGSWTDNTGWLTDTTVGNWYGVTVTSDFLISSDGYTLVSNDTYTLKVRSA